MVGQMTASKPSRSDEVLDSEEQVKIANQIRAQFDSMAPKRPSKPNRSEPDIPFSPNPVDPSTDLTIPELHKLRSLQSQSQVLFSEEGSKTVTEEFVETQYYKELDSIDKQHHTTGSGFIKVVREGNDKIELGEGHFGGVGTVVSTVGFRSNPATNDWVPKNMDEDDQIWECERISSAKKRPVVLLINIEDPNEVGDNNISDGVLKSMMYIVDAGNGLGGNTQCSSGPVSSCQSLRRRSPTK